MPVEKVFTKQAKPKKEKEVLTRAEHMKKEAKIARELKAARLEEAERKRQEADKHAVAALKAAVSKDPAVEDLTDEHGPKTISTCIAKAMGIQGGDKMLPKEVLEKAVKQMPDEDLGGGPPKEQLLSIARVLAERKAAKKARDAEKQKIKDAAKAADSAALEAKAAARREEKAAELEAHEASLLEANLARAAAEPEPETECAVTVAKKKVSKKKQPKKDRGTGGAVELGPDGKPLDDLQMTLAKFRATSGVLGSRPDDTNIKIDKFSLAYAGPMLIQECTLELNQECRYGLIGENGSGKTNMINAIALREVPIPEHIDMFHLHREAHPTDRSALESLVDHVKMEVVRLTKMSDEIMEEFGPEDMRLIALGERLDELDPQYFEIKARKVLAGLGFAEHVVPMERKTKHMSGGWRMRVSLGQALFSTPSILLLDEPTNHLDLEACIWLEDHLAGYKKCLLTVSHSQDFMNTVCNRIIWLIDKKLNFYTGNFEMYCKLVENEDKVQTTAWNKQVMDIEKLQDFIRKNMANKKTYKSAQSKQKVLDKIMETAVEKPRNTAPSFTFEFLECHRLPPPVLPFDRVSFAYSGDLKVGDVLYKDLDIGVDCDSRIALVGPNGSGKSTLLKLMSGDLQPTSGTVGTKSGCVKGFYHQHSADALDLDLSPLEFFEKMYPPELMKKIGMPAMTVETWRAFLGQFGISGGLQLTQIAQLSDGQKSRLIFAMVRMNRPNLLLLDEPTNHLDVGAIDGLARAIKAYNGGVVLVSHDFRLLQQTAKSIWIVDQGKVTIWGGDIASYKQSLVENFKAFEA